MPIERFGANPSGPGGRALPFTKAVRAGDFVFVSGQVPMGPDGEIVAGSIASPDPSDRRQHQGDPRRARSWPRTCRQGDGMARRHARFLAVQQGLQRVFRRSAAGPLLRARRHDGRLQGRDRGDCLRPGQVVPGVELVECKAALSHIGSVRSAAVNPLSTNRWAPLMKLASSLARNSAALATSSGSPMRTCCASISAPRCPCRAAADRRLRACRAACG